MSPIPFHAAQAAPRPDPPGPTLLPPGDARWVLAARASLAARSGRVGDAARRSLTAWAASRGVLPIHAASIIAIAERAASRGGLDATDAAAIARMPAPCVPRAPDRLGRALRLVIGVQVVVAAVLLAARMS